MGDMIARDAATPALDVVVGTYAGVVDIVGLTWLLCNHTTTTSLSNHNGFGRLQHNGQPSKQNPQSCRKVAH